MLIGICEVSEIAEVSPRQLRYWEDKGYISSIAKDANGPRKFRLLTVVKEHCSKRFL
ncbi:MerR family DNA-binding transcriptional regulator, partial [Enterococcus faecalis]|uniref:MerR family DNA-binding transcriptional regulator n=1 Tax=Enterococcus faecalis TaxID=1351 RepID=UPI003CC53B6C